MAIASAITAAVIAGAAGAGTAAIGARAQSGAARRAQQSQDRAGERAEALERERMQFEREDATRREAEDRQRWEAEQGMAQRMWDTQEEERLFRRRIFEEDRQADKDREAGMQASRDRYDAESANWTPPPEDPRLAQRRQMQQQAMATLGDLLKQRTPGRRVA